MLSVTDLPILAAYTDEQLSWMAFKIAKGLNSMSRAIALLNKEQKYIDRLS